MTRIVDYSLANVKGLKYIIPLEIDQAAAAIVREILEHYAEGLSPQRIAADLNARRVRSPRGGTWAVSAIYGNPKKGSGILNNDLYIGRYVWNRSQWLKDPDTGRRQRVDRPPEEWQISDRPELAIVPLELWNRVRQRMDKPAHAGRRGRGQPPRTLFGGLMRCGICAGAVIAVSAGSYGCAARKDRGATVCAGIRVQRKALDTRLLAHVRQEVASPEALAAMQADVGKILAEQRRDRAQAAGRSQARRQELDHEIRNLVDAVAAFGPSEAIKGRLRAAESARAALQTAQAPEAQGGAIPALLAAYRRMLADLRHSLERDTPKARELLRDLLGEIKLTQGQDGTFAELENDTGRLLLAAGAIPNMVAGTRFGNQNRVRIRIR